jgi:hypothetical protein
MSENAVLAGSKFMLDRCQSIYLGFRSGFRFRRRANEKSRDRAWSRLLVGWLPGKKLSRLAGVNEPTYSAANGSLLAKS